MENQTSVSTRTLNNSIGDRINMIISFLSITPKEFVEEIGINRSALSHIQNGRNQPSLDVIMKIIKRYPHVNSNWLLFGQGNMNNITTSDGGDGASSSTELLGGLFHDNTIFQTDSPPTHEKENLRELRDLSILANSPRKPARSAAAISNPLNTQLDAPRETPHEKRSVTKITVYYSDRTYETFVPEDTSKSK